MSSQHGIPPTSRNTRTSAQAQEQHRRDAERLKKQQADAPQDTAKAQQSFVADGGVVVPVKATLPAADGRGYRQKYIDEVAPASFPGKLIKFSREGAFVVTENGEELDTARDFVALVDETLIGWIKFHEEEGTAPDRVQGLLYDGFVMPPRESLGDLDPAKWPIGLSGAAEDPWQHQAVLVLQDRETLDLYSFATSSKTGRRAVGNLLRHYDRLSRSHPDHYPVIRLKASGFNHRDQRIGWVHTPAFAVVGRAPKADAAVPDTSVGADLNDKIPF